MSCLNKIINFLSFVLLLTSKSCPVTSSSYYLGVESGSCRLILAPGCVCRVSVVTNCWNKFRFSVYLTIAGYVLLAITDAVMVLWWRTTCMALGHSNLFIQSLQNTVCNFIRWKICLPSIEYPWRYRHSYRITYLLIQTSGYLYFNSCMLINYHVIYICRKYIWNMCFPERTRLLRRQKYFKQIRS